MDTYRRPQTEESFPTDSSPLANKVIPIVQKTRAMRGGKQVAEHCPAFLMFLAEQLLGDSIGQMGELGLSSL